MRNLINGFGAALIALAALAGCGGGGGGDTSGQQAQAPGQPASSPTGGGGSGGNQATCPDGSPLVKAADCPALKIVSSTPSAGATADPVALAKGMTFTFSGTLSPASVKVELLQGPLTVTGSVSVSADNKTITFVPTMRPAYSQATVNAVITAVDSAGNSANTNVVFGTQAMSCTDNARWSNPALYVPLVQDCVAPIGVQAVLDTAYNKMTDTSCTVTAGQKLSATCQAYLANGTFALTNTGTVIASGNAPVWGAWFGNDGSSNLMVLDSATLNVVATTVLPNPLAWGIGNPLGIDTGLTVGGVTQNTQVSWDGTTIVLKCQSHC